MKQLDNEYDKVREDNPNIDQDDWQEVFELLEEDIYFHGGSFAMHKLDFFQYLTMLPATFFDIATLMLLPYIMAGALDICSIVIYQFLIIHKFADRVDWNEWVVVIFNVCAIGSLVAFGPDPSAELNELSSRDEQMVSSSHASVALVCTFILIKVYTYYFLRKNMIIIISKKNAELISDFYKPRPASAFNLAGPFHLAVNDVIVVMIFKSLMIFTDKWTGDGSYMALVKSLTQIAAIIAFVLTGIGCSAGCVHTHHDMIGELHSATVFPTFIMLKTSFNIIAGVVCFLEQPKNHLFFWISFAALMIGTISFVCVMEHNEPPTSYDVHRQSSELEIFVQTPCEILKLKPPHISPYVVMDGDSVNDVTQDSIKNPSTSPPKLSKVKSTPFSTDTLCKICGEEFDLDSQTSLLPCSHEFHVKCLMINLRSTPNCPTCGNALQLME